MNLRYIYIGNRKAQRVMVQREERRRVAHRKNLQNRLSMTLVMLVVVVLLVVVGIRGYGLSQKLEDLQAQWTENEEKKAKLEAEAAEIAEYEKYTKTLKYYEEMAKKKLGLVYEDEIIFMQED